MKRSVSNEEICFIYFITCIIKLSFSGCGGGSDDKGASNGRDNQVYTMVESQEMPSADPSLATDEVSFTTLNNVYEGIYRLDKDNKPAPVQPKKRLFQKTV